MTRSEEQRVKRLAAAIQREIISCPNEQSYEGGQIEAWIDGCATDVGDLLMNHNVPEKLRGGRQPPVLPELRQPHRNLAGGGNEILIRERA